LLSLLADGGVCTAATGTRQTNDMSFVSQFHGCSGAYGGNMEQGLQQQLLIQTPNNN
jgi:hypothetical protein